MALTDQTEEVSGTGGVLCPYCQCQRSSVGRTIRVEGAIVRYRKCLDNSEHNFRTEEYVMMSNRKRRTATPGVDNATGYPNVYSTELIESVVAAYTTLGSSIATISTSLGIPRREVTKILQTRGCK